jgi:protein phosphatase
VLLPSHDGHRPPVHWVHKVIRLGQNVALLTAQYNARTDVGRVREINEDRVFAGELQPLSSGGAAWLLLVVADGVGGLERGEWASERAVAVVTAEVPMQLTSREPREALRLAIETANQLISQQDATRPDSRLSPAATTLVAAIVGEGQLWWANVGDSRAYLIGGDGVGVDQGQVQRLTRDHSWVEEQIRRGSLTPEQARLSERRNVITRSIGFQPEVEVDTGGPVTLQPSDVIVLCSDGLHGLLADEEIARLARTYPPAEATERLIALSNERGGTDNISVIVYTHAP